MRLITLFTLLIWATWSLSQKYNFNNYTVENGLSQSQINAINQDELGYLWIATESGLSRFDGNDFVNFSMDNGLPDNKVEIIFLDEKNKLWVGTHKGIAYFENGKFIPYYFSEQYKINDLASFNDKLYIATNEGLIEFSDHQFTQISARDTDQLYIRSIVNYRDSILICGSKTGVYTWNEKYSELKDSTLLQLNVSGVEIQNNHLIISTYGDGLIKYSIAKNKLKNYNLNLFRIRSVYADEHVILCSTLNGAIEIKNDTATYFSEKNGMINERMRCAFRDNENNYWIGTDGNGLLKFLGKSIISYSTDDDLSSNLVMSITQDEEGNLVFGTYDKGITKLHTDSSVMHINTDNGLPHNSIWSTYFDKSGKHWIATSRGIVCWENGQYVLKEITNSIKTKIRSICETPSAIYFGGTEGVYAYENDSVHFIESTAMLNINDLCSDGDNLFIGSRTGLFSISTIDYYDKLTPLSEHEESINSLTFDENQNLWIGTNNGLNIRLTTGHTVPILLDKEDFKSKTIFGLLKSQNGSIWVSTMNGVYQISQSINEGFNYSINHYASAEGLINLESNQNAIYEDQAHKIWVGTSNGLARIDPALNKELFKFEKPVLHFTGIRLYMEDFDYNRFNSKYEEGAQLPYSLSLPYNQNHLTFDFIGLNLKDPESVQYEYRLVGATETWSPISKTNSATYSSIAPGDYEFQVRATNKSFKWSDTKSIQITIRAPFWKTWWFILLTFTAGGIIILLLFQSRIRAIKQKQENEKLGYKNRLLFLEQQSLNASMNRHFIFNSLNSIQYFINSSDKRSANKYLSSFAKLIRQNLDSSTATNFVVTLQEEIDRIQLYLTLEKMRFQEKFDYILTVDSSLDTEGIEIPSMILQPFVENAIIHGVLPLERKGKIEIKIYPEFDEIVFEVVDDGIGIDNTLKNKKTQSAGDHESKGMEITNRRIELLRKLTGDNLLIIGPFQVNNEANECLGTKVIIKMGMNEEE